MTELWPEFPKGADTSQQIRLRWFDNRTRSMTEEFVVGIWNNPSKGVQIDCVEVLQRNQKCSWCTSIYCPYTTVVASYPGSSPCRKAGREPGRSDHVPRDVLCVVLVIKLLPTQSVLSFISADTAVVVCR